MEMLTSRQQEILAFLIHFTRTNGFPPTVREICDRFGFFLGAAQVHLKALEKKGRIRINPAKSRGIEIFGLKPSEGIMLPVAGRIRAGEPILAVESIDSHILVDKELFSAEDAFCLTITGESMIDAGIFEGDYVIVRPQKTIDSGEIGVVLVEDEATVKRVFRKKNKVTLKPENKAMKPVSYAPSEVSIIGKVIGVIRKF